jgi:preprotein translocase subunit SecE
MSETNNNQKESKLGGFWSGLSAEFKKIIWPDRVTVVKQTITVTVISVILGLLIALIDTIVQYGVNFLTM